MRPSLFALLLSPTLALSEPVEAELYRCARLPEASARLSCYDALAAALQSKRQAPRPAQALPETERSGSASAASPTEAQKIEAFGAPMVAAKDQLSAIESHIEGRVDGWQAGTVFQLGNGQRWMVADGSRATLELRNPKVVIRRAAMGTFRIEFEGSNQTARVKRL